MLIFSLSAVIITSHLFASVKCIKVDSDFLDRVLAVHNAKLPNAEQIDRINDVAIDKTVSGVYDESKITMRGQMKNGELRNISLQASEVPADGFRRTLVLGIGMFNKTYCVYNDVLPKMRDLMKAANDTGEPLFLDLMDAKNGSYVVIKIPGRGWAEGLGDSDPTMADLKLVLRSLAKWHAMTAVLMEKGQIPQAIFAERLPPRIVNKFYGVLLANFAAVMRVSWGKKWKYPAQYIENTVPQLDQKLRAIFNQRNEADEFKVLNIGDFHWPYVWFCCGVTDTLESDHPHHTAIKFDVFDVSHINTPAFDLHNVIYSTPNPQVVLKYKDDLIKNAYYPALMGYLTKFGYAGQKPTLSWLKDEVRRTELYGIIISINFVYNFVLKEEVPVILVRIEEAWRSQVTKINQTAMLKRRFADDMKPVMEFAMDRKIFGKRSRSEEDSKSGSESDSDSDSD